MKNINHSTITKKFIQVLIGLGLIAGCSTHPTNTTVVLEDNSPTMIYEGNKTTIQPTNQSTPENSPGIIVKATHTPKLKTNNPSVSPFEPTATYDINSWKNLPVIPVLNESLLDIYHRGLDNSNNPQAFSKIGDCGSTPTWFLGDFDKGERFYNLGDYSYLGDIIEYYQGSFNRLSLAAKSGFNASSVLTPLWSDKNICKADEPPLFCEYRIHQPIIAFITLGANDVYHEDSFEAQMRKIIVYSIDNGVIPVVSTKPDNIEGNHLINSMIARLAYEYEIPLWNYWLAVQPLPNHGLQADGVHITWRANWFNDPETLNWGWPVRNLTALQVLDAIWRFVNKY